MYGKLAQLVTFSQSCGLAAAILRIPADQTGVVDLFVFSQQTKAFVEQESYLPVSLSPLSFDAPK